MPGGRLQKVFDAFDEAFETFDEAMKDFFGGDSAKSAIRIVLPVEKLVRLQRGEKLVFKAGDQTIMIEPKP